MRRRVEDAKRRMHKEIRVLRPEKYGKTDLDQRKRWQIYSRAKETSKLVRSHSDARSARMNEDVFSRFHPPYHDEGLKRYQGNQAEISAVLQYVELLRTRCRAVDNYLPVNQTSGMLAACTQDRYGGFGMM